MLYLLLSQTDPSVQAAELLWYDRSGPAGVSGRRSSLSAQEQPGVHLQQNRLGHGCAGKQETHAKG